MQNKILFLLLLSIITLPVVSAANLDIPLPTSLGNSYGTFKAGGNISLIQTCTNLTAFCDLCNLTSLNYPDGTIITANVEMTKNLALFNYTLIDAFTNTIGKYTVTGFCIGGGVYSPFAYNFEIAPDKHSGMTDAQAILISLSLLVIIITGLFMAVIGFRTEHIGIKAAFIGTASICLAILIFYTLVIMNYVVVPQSIINGYTTFAVIAGIIMGVAVLAFIIYAGLMAYSLWRIKRGRED